MRIELESVSPPVSEDYYSHTRHRLKAYRDILRSAYKNIPESLKDKNVVLVIRSLPFNLHLLDNREIAAICHEDSIDFIFRNEDTLPDVESLTWLVSHEMAHRKCGHYPDCGKTHDQMENEARSIQSQYGIMWSPEYCFK